MDTEPVTIAKWEDGAYDVFQERVQVDEQIAVLVRKISTSAALRVREDSLAKNRRRCE